MPLRPGDRFGRYQLIDLLGRGGMGEVYSAEDTLLVRRVALKVLHPPPEEPAGEPGDKSRGGRRVLRGARAAASLDHPNAVAIYDVGEVDGVAFLAMELVPGKTLLDFVGDESTSLQRRLRWLIDIAGALGA